MKRTATEKERLNEVEKIVQRISVDVGNLNHLIPLLSKQDETLLKANQYEGSIFLIKKRSAAILQTIEFLKSTIDEQ